MQEVLLEKLGIKDENVSIIVNFDRPSNRDAGLIGVEVPDLGEPFRGKVRDNWVLDGPNDEKYLLMVTTDRQSAFDRLICTIPHKGEVLNLLSAYWFINTSDIVPNHIVDVPFSNVMLARHVSRRLPVEVVLRRYMAKSATSTSLYHNYVNLGRREIYGIHFPDNMGTNEELPVGTVITPTTKAEHGHDQELTDNQAAELVDSELGDGVWQRAKTSASAIFERGYKHCLEYGLILADTKYEFGVDKDGNLLLIDEIHTPDSSRFWQVDTYQQRLQAGQNPDNYDKDILRNWLAQHGFKGEGRVPMLDPDIIKSMMKSYAVPYELITGRSLPEPQDISLESGILGYVKGLRLATAFRQWSE